MFSQLIKSLFSPKSVDARAIKTPDLKAVNTSGSVSKPAVKPSATMPQATPAESDLNLDEKYQLEFYQFLFGQSLQTHQADELSEYISGQIEGLLKSPDAILDNLPLLPASLTEIIRQINLKEFDTQKVVKLLQQEPAIAAKVLQLANSPFYNRSGKEITDLKGAFMQLGVDGLSEGVINGFISRLTPQSDIYFRFYGQKLWRHSLCTGEISRQLALVADKSNASQAYLAGLLSNLGEIMIYQLMIEGFSVVHPDVRPGSRVFIQLLGKHAKKLTFFIARHWRFPQPIQEVLSLQAKLHSSSLLPQCQQKNPVACHVYEARLISELTLRYEHKALSDEEVFTAISALLHSTEAKDYLSYLFTYQWKKHA